MVTASANGLSGFVLPAGNGRGVDRLGDDLMDHPADRGQLGVVERLGGVVGRVIARVFAGREEEERDAAAAERAVVAAIQDQDVGTQQADGQRPAPAPPRRSRAASPARFRCPSRTRAMSQTPASERPIMSAVTKRTTLSSGTGEWATK